MQSESVQIIFDLTFTPNLHICKEFFKQERGKEVGKQSY